jgi:IS605 OrfB family transposase
MKLGSFAAARTLIYKRLDESANKDLFDYIKENFDLNDIEVRSAIAQTKQTKDGFIAGRDNLSDVIKDLNEDLADLQKELVKIQALKSTDKRKKKIKQIKRKIFRLKHKIFRKEKSMGDEIVFGGKHLLRKLGYLHNDKIKNADDIIKTKDEYVINRLGSMYLLGEANQKGNRFFDFNLINNKIIYKPFKGKKIEIDYDKRNGFDAASLQELIDNKQISITISMNEKQICLMYDEAIVSGYAINEAERRKEVKKAQEGVFTKEEKTAIAKEIYANYYKELRNRQMMNKIPNRYLGIDINPEYIGYSIIDLNEDNTYNIIKAGCYDLSALCKKTGKSSDSDIAKKRNNKRKYERSQAVCDIFRMMKHYKVGSFVMEDLNFKNSSEIKEFNRKTKNIWDREKLTAQIKKKCTEGGYQFIEVNPVYSSFIGNFTNKVFDPVGASIEINRRGATKYLKGFFYPDIDLSTVRAAVMMCKKCHTDVELIRDKSWKELYTIFNKFRYRWGVQVGEPRTLSLKTYKSRVKVLEYNDVSIFTSH